MRERRTREGCYKVIALCVVLCSCSAEPALADQSRLLAQSAPCVEVARTASVAGAMGGVFVTR